MASGKKKQQKKTHPRTTRVTRAKDKVQKPVKVVSTKRNNYLLKPFLLLLFIVPIFSFLLWVAFLDFQVRDKFEGKRWAVPAKVYSRPLEIFSGLQMQPSNLRAELGRLQYQESKKPDKPGSFRVQIQAGNSAHFDIVTRAFYFPDGQQVAEAVSISIVNGIVSESSHVIVRLDPLLIGGIYPKHNEDRVLIRLEDTPEYLIETLVLVEDRLFFEHAGISFKSIFRAALVNLFSGRIRQGGSTLTQQLVKNFYLTHERSFSRKINEAMMAVLLEYHYSKSEILEAYLNEVNLGQIGARGVHGFGLASQHYFGVDIDALELHQVALLVALVKGPSFYEPRRNPERARDRRNLVLSIMAENGFIEAKQYQHYAGKNLDLTEQSSLRHQNYPAFLDLVKRQLKRDYSDADLQSEGMRIFTSFDPMLQAKAEQSLLESVERLRGVKGRQQENNLQAAMVVVSPQQGEVQALVSGTELRVLGFNRSLDARRPVGSLVKPAIYLTALQSKVWHWASLISDELVVVRKNGMIDETINVGDLVDNNDNYWVPRNFDRKVHGNDGLVTLMEAHAQSYNQATVRLGLELGIVEIVKTLQLLGLQSRVNQYPAVLLGAFELSPFEITQIYQTIASGGFYTPLKAIRDVQHADGRVLTRYPFNVEQRVDAKQAYLLQVGLQEVVRSGTAKSLQQRFTADLALAGKTGTTNDSRDSWFVGYSGNMLATVWLGNDDNSETPFTGASGALKVWADFAGSIPLQPNSESVPEGVTWVWIDTEQQLLSAENCPDVVYVPMLLEQLPKQKSECALRQERPTFRQRIGL